MKHKLVSVKQIANKLKQNPVMNDLTWEFIIDQTVECLGLIGGSPIYVDKVVDLQVKDFRAILPADFMGMTSVSWVEKDGQTLTAMRTGEDTLHQHYAGFQSLPQTHAGRTYQMSHSALFTNEKEGNIILAYKTLATDEECYPLVPGQPEVLRAIEYYIRYRWYDILNDLDQMSMQKLNKVEQEYSFAVGQAQAAIKMLSPDEMESFVNSFVQLMPDRLQHADRFQYLGAMETLKIQA